MDKHRPQYHFLPPANWMNDPNGLVQWQGVYHLFYQYNPNQPFWGDIHWGHATSHDLVHWEHQPVALAPTPGGPDEGGVWSGCAVDWNGTPVLIYTGRLGLGENVCLATSADGLVTWEKYPGNPVIAGSPAGIETVGFRDPCVWKAGDGWRMVMGSGIPGIGGAILLYSSTNLTDWAFIGPLVVGDLHQREPVWSGEMWECPNFFPLGEAENPRHVLMISPMDLHPSRSLYTLAMLGDFSENRFIPSSVVKVDGGDVSFYAPQVFRDEKGRRITIGWAREARSVDASIAAGWAGVMTLPRLLGLSPDGALTQQPVPEVDRLRGESMEYTDILLEPGAQNLTCLDGVSGDTLELDITFDLAEAGSRASGDFGLYVRRSPGGEEQTEIRVDGMAGRLVVDTVRSSLNRDVEPGQYEIPLDVSGRVDLRVFLDRSMIEVYANDRAVITTRVYPQRDDSMGIGLFANHRPVRVQKLASYKMASIW